MEGPFFGVSVATWLRVFLPLAARTEGLLPPMSQKVRFFAVGAGDVNRWLGLFSSPAADASLCAFLRLTLVATLLSPVASSQLLGAFLLIRPRMNSSFCLSCIMCSFFSFSISASNVFTFLCSSKTFALSAVGLLESGVLKIDRLTFLWVELGVETWDEGTGDCCGDMFEASDWAWTVSSFCWCFTSCSLRTLFSFCSSSNSLAWSVSDSGTFRTSSFTVVSAYKIIRWLHLILCSI